MGLSIGIVGLPNVGKSTTFNALTRAQNAEAANYPFCTIEASRAVVPVPDNRLKRLAEIVNPKKIVAATVEFVDIAGLVKGASKGEGLGNKFLNNIRDTEAIIHLVRCFDDENVVHVTGSVDPIRDIEIINTELILSDIQTVEKRIEKLEKQARGDKKIIPMLNVLKELIIHLNEGKQVNTFDKIDDDVFLELNKEMKLLTNKKVIFAANVDESGLAEDNKYYQSVKEYASQNNCQIIKICSKIEEEMADMSNSEREEFLESLGAKNGSGLDQVITKGYETLGLISYFTAGPKEVKAWTIHKGWKAPKSASVIHNDFEKGFIRAEIISYDTYIEYNGESGSRAAGQLRTEGKEYIIQDGDVIHFLFNV